MAASLKAQPGKTIGVAGRPTPVRSLIRHDLLDGVDLMVYLVIAGSGQRLFGEGDAPKRFRLAYSNTTRSGVAHLTYRLTEREWQRG